MKGDIFTCEDNILFSHVKISSFRAKAHLAFHWCLYNKIIFNYLLLFLPSQSVFYIQSAVRGTPCDVISFVLTLHMLYVEKLEKRKISIRDGNDIVDICHHDTCISSKFVTPLPFLPHPELKRPGNETEVNERRIIHNVLTGSNMAAVCRAFRLLGITSGNIRKSGQ